MLMFFPVNWICLWTASAGTEFGVVPGCSAWVRLLGAEPLAWHGYLMGCLIMNGQISLPVKGRGLLHEPFSRSDLLRVLERERVRETPTGPDPSPSGWPLCKGALNRPGERLFNWAVWRWQSAPHLWVDLYPVTISRRGTSWTLILHDRWEIVKKKIYIFWTFQHR